jgi:hypothetical protein
MEYIGWFTVAWVLVGCAGWVRAVIERNRRGFGFEWREDLKVLPICAALGPFVLLGLGD